MACESGHLVSLPDGYAAVVFQGPEVALPDMLAARERRVDSLRAMLAAARQNEALLCLTLSIPGPVKTSPVLERVFDELVCAAESELADVAVRERRRTNDATGPEYYALVELPTHELKLRMVGIEEGHPLGRLGDLDVLARADDMPGQAAVNSISRRDLGLPLRRCLICGGEAKACARSRAHTVEEMQARIATIIEQGGYSQP